MTKDPYEMMSIKSESVQLDGLRSDPRFSRLLIVLAWVRICSAVVRILTISICFDCEPVQKLKMRLSPSSQSCIVN